MYYVYLIQSISNPQKRYVGYTTNIKNRLETHNSGGSIYTKDDMPWKIIVCVSFGNSAKALAFEKYLKSGSGNSFAQKRLW